MYVTAVLLALIAADEPSDDAKTSQKTDAVRSFYAETAVRYEFFRDADKKEPLTLVKKPVFKWSTDDDWSGDVFVWTYAQRPEMIGCILSGPRTDGARDAYQEFHLLGEKPIAAADMLSRFRWAPVAGLETRPVTGAAAPAETAQLRLTQMRQIQREFTAYMQANGEWELRPLTQPLMRYQPMDSDVIDGALFAYIWPKGTDPELVLLLECRKTATGLEWRFAPARFSIREMWLKNGGKEVWRCPNLAGANNSNPEKAYVSAPMGTVPKARLEGEPEDAAKPQ